MNKTLTNKAIDIFAKYHSDLVTNWYKRWKTEINQKMCAWTKVTPNWQIKAVFTDDYIDSEITSAILKYLAPKFKGGFFPAYCDLYVTKIVVSRLWHEWKQMQHDVIEAYHDYEFDYDCVESHDIVELESDLHKKQIKNIEDQDDVKFIFSQANQLDKLIMQEILTTSFKNYDELAKKLGISKGTITKRLAKYKTILKNERH